MKEKEFGNIYSLGEDLDERFAWCVQLIDNELCIAIHCTTQSGHSPFGKSSVSCPLKPSDSAPLKHSTMPP
jgi:hypothetical protein